MKFVNYKILIGAGFLIILLFVLKNVAFQLIEVRDGSNVIEGLKEGLGYAKNQNKFLKERLKYVQTDKFIEEESRERLGLVKEGEFIVRETFETEVKKRTEEALSPPNWKQWVNLFF